MITGVETAGLVLAIFPLLVSALEHYQEGFERLSDWWKFRTEFLGLMHAIGRQAILFDETRYQVEVYLLGTVIAKSRYNFRDERVYTVTWTA